MALHEALGPAEKLIQFLTTHADHAYHGRPGVVVNETWYQTKFKSTDQLPVGQRYQPAGLFEDVVVKLYDAVAQIWKLDNKISAKLASWAFTQKHRDLKVILAAFMLVQTRKGDPVRGEGTAIEFFDDDYRDVGEAICLLQDKGNDLNAKLLLRVAEVLELPRIAEMNRKLGFTTSRKPFLGRWPKVATKWLEYREANSKMLDGLIRAGFRKTVCRIAQKVGYKPASPVFFEMLRWKQVQAEDGRRTVGLTVPLNIALAENWVGLSETAICERIQATRPNWKRIMGLLPKEVGITRAIVGVTVENQLLSDTDLILLTPTLEALGLLTSGFVFDRWKQATAAATSQRAAVIAKRVRSQEVADTLQSAAETAAATAMAQVTKGLRIYFLVDVSGSMSSAIDQAKAILEKLLVAFPLEQIHIATFSTVGVEIVLKGSSAAAVRNAFAGKSAGGGTYHAAGLSALCSHLPKDDEDTLIIVVGDEGEDSRVGGAQFIVQAEKLHASAIALVRVGRGAEILRSSAATMGIPFFEIDPKIFEDSYGVQTTLQRLIASTPVRKDVETSRRVRVDLLTEIMKAPLLVKPEWA